MAMSSASSSSRLLLAHTWLGLLTAKNVSPYRSAKKLARAWQARPAHRGRARTKEARLAAIAELRAFRAAHREAKRR